MVPTVPIAHKPKLSAWAIHSLKRESGAPGREWEVNKMKRPTLKFIDKYFTASILALVITLIAMSITVSAQKVALATYDLDQCRNGLIDAPVDCALDAWVNGNAGASNSHWAESQFVPYRVKLSGLVPGPTVHSIVISFDRLTSDMAVHTMDYLGTYNYTETTADPCSGIAGCVLANGITFPVPLDPLVTGQINPNTGGNVQQIPGVVSIWGGQILSAAYTAVDHPHEQHLTLTFTASVDNPVIAWGAHIAWIGDWGAGNSASTVSGASYHMRIDEFDGTGGNTDRGLSAASVTPSGVVVIVKEVTTFDLGSASSMQFPFTSTSNFGKTNFSLVDNNVLGPDRELSQPITSFGVANTINVTEAQLWGYGWTLADILCTEVAPANSTVNLLTRTASIVVDSNEVVTCTFKNTQYRPTAASVSLGGRVMLKDGTPISGATVTLTDINLGDVYRTRTGPFGYYKFTELPVGDTYNLTVMHKRYMFYGGSLSFTMVEDITDLDLYGFLNE